MKVDIRQEAYKAKIEEMAADIFNSVKEPFIGQFLTDLKDEVAKMRDKELHTHKARVNELEGMKL